MSNMAPLVELRQPPKDAAGKWSGSEAAAVFFSLYGCLAPISASVCASALSTDFRASVPMGRR